jgi:tetratricopeptide (TPR) repeat protein
MTVKYQKVKVPTVVEGVETNVLLEVEKGNDGLVKGAGYILNDFITKWQNTCKKSDAYKAAETALKNAETAVNTYKNAKSGKLGAEYTSLSQAKNDITKQRAQFVIDNADYKNALAQIVAAEAGIITSQAAADEAAANLAAAKAFEGVDSYVKVLEAYNAAMASNPNILTEYQAALKNYNTAFGYVKSQITSVNTLFKTLNTQADILNKALKNSDIAKAYYRSAEFKGVYSEQFLGALDNVYNETVKNTTEANVIVDLALAKFIETLTLAKTIIPNTDTELKLVATRVEVKADGTLDIKEPEVVEEETEEEEIPEYEYTKYTDDSGNIVYVEYENGTFFLLNYSYYAVTVEFNGVSYTLEASGGVKVVPGQEPQSFSFAKIN